MVSLGVHQLRAVVHKVQPLQDCRWDALVRKCQRSSVFHTRGWFEALRRTYGYEPIVFTTSPPDAEIENGLVFCRIDSWLTGRRLVSLPFSDHCEPLGADAAEMQILVSAAAQEVIQGKLDYMEIRSKSPLGVRASLPQSDYSYCYQQLDLAPDLATLFRNCHKDSTQSKIRRAEREGLRYEEGRSEALLDHFYRLLLLTRRRHQVPPQPKRWFLNLANCMGEALKVRVAFKDKQAAAAVLTLRHKNVLFYKYGCSDNRFHNLGVMHLLIWRAIQEAKEEGMWTFDLGRSNADSLGLITFKERWGCVSSTVTYTRYCRASGSGYATDGSWKERIGKRVVSLLPGLMFQAVGQALYRHVG